MQLCLEALLNLSQLLIWKMRLMMQKFSVNDFKVCRKVIRLKKRKMVLGMMVKKPDSSGGDSFSTVDYLKPLKHRLMAKFKNLCICMYMCIYSCKSGINREAEGLSSMTCSFADFSKKVWDLCTAYFPKNLMFFLIYHLLLALRILIKKISQGHTYKRKIFS